MTEYIRAMRESHVCPKCRFNRVLWIAKVPDRGDHGVTHQANIAVTFAGDGFFGEKTGHAGHLGACVCRRCGFTELYTSNIDDIRVDGTYVQEMVGPEPADPYR